MPAVALYGVFFVLPAIATFFMAFTDWSIYHINRFDYVGLDNFRSMFNQSYFGKAVYNTFYFAVVTVILKLVLGFALALIVDRGLRLTSFYRSVFFIPATFSTMVVAIVFSALYHPQYGPINTGLRELGLGMLTHEWLVDPRFAMNSIVLMDVWQFAGINMVIFLAGFQSIPRDYFESATVDGAGYFQKVRHITVPLVMMSITVNTLLNLIGGMKVFAQVYSLTNGGPNDATQVFSTLIFKNFGSGVLGMASAVNLVFTVLLCVMGYAVTRTMRKLEVEYS